MSGHSYENSCPNCEGNMRMYTDHKPYDYIGGSCPECGFTISTTTSYMNLEDLNEHRAELSEDDDPDDISYPKLDKLPEQEFEKEFMHT